MFSHLNQLPIVEHGALLLGLWFGVQALMKGLAMAQGAMGGGAEPADAGAAGALAPNAALGVNPANGLPMATPLLDIEGNVRYFDGSEGL